ncbi:hypothetical protein [Bartonella tribocorum]|uniref:hypothetical protein n=1 Tax=Bartonella tribocorum TaxID=85701 RepID=UPI000C1E0313|nr:hypothetical protein [Bartonella tribocorum]
MSASLILGVFIGVGTVLFIYAAFCSVLFSTVMTILALYYSLIKRTILLWAMRRKLKKETAQDLRHDQTKGRGRNTVLATQFSALSFKESLLLSREECRMIFSITFVMFVLFTGFIVFSAFLPKSAIFLQNHAPFLLYIGFFVIGLLFRVWEFIVVALPVILILHRLLTFGVKNTTRRLEKFA